MHFLSWGRSSGPHGRSVLLFLGSHLEAQVRVAPLALLEAVHEGTRVAGVLLVRVFSHFLLQGQQLFMRFLSFATWVLLL
jgi:hypothetical protein